MAQPVGPQQLPILISTMNDVPGYRVTHVFGEMCGLIVRSRGFGANFGAAFKSLGGGEIGQYTQLLNESRNEAVGRLAQQAMAHGANAVIAMRFDCNEIAQTMSEVAAYGTAVYIVPDGASAPQLPGQQAGQPQAPQQQQAPQAPQQSAPQQAAPQTPPQGQPAQGQQPQQQYPAQGQYQQQYPQQGQYPAQQYPPQG